MKERFEEAKPVATGSNRRGLPVKEIKETSLLGTPLSFSLGVSGPQRNTRSALQWPGHREATDQGRETHYDC